MSFQGGLELTFGYPDMHLNVKRKISLNKILRFEATRKPMDLLWYGGHPGPAIRTPLNPIILNQSADRTNCAIHREPELGEIDKDAFQPVIDLKFRSAYRTGRWTWVGRWNGVKAE